MTAHLAFGVKPSLTTTAMLPVQRNWQRFLGFSALGIALLAAGCRGAATDIPPTVAPLDQAVGQTVDTTTNSTTDPNAVNAVATSVPPTIDPNLPTLPPPVAGRDVTVYDEAGATVAKAALRVFAPTQVKIGQAVEVRLEVSLYDFDPSYGQPNPTITAYDLNIPATEREYMLLRQFMTGGIRAGNIAQFDLQSQPPDGYIEVKLNELNVWRFVLTPKPDAAAGRNVLEAYLFLPMVNDDQATLKESISIPFDFEIVP